MKVSGTNGTGGAAASRAARVDQGGGGFRVPVPGVAAGPASLSAATASAAVMGVEALLALQDVGGPLERRRRAADRAGRILDELDGVKLALLGGEGVTGLQLDRLRRAVRDQRDVTDDAGLEALLDDVELRAAVEMAKLEKAARVV